MRLTFFLVLYMDAEKISKNISFPFNALMALRRKQCFVLTQS